MIKLGCCSWSYHRALRSKRIDFYEWLRICAEDLAVDGVDIIAEQAPSRTARCWLDIRKRCADAHLTVISLSPSNNFGRPTAAARRAEVDQLRRWIDTAVTLGSPYVRIFSGWAPADRHAALWKPMVSCIRAVATSAAQAGITLLVEPHNHGGLLPDSQSTLRLIRELNSPWVRVNLDVGNYVEPDRYAGIEATLPFAPHVVAKVQEVTSAGGLGFDYERIVAMLKRRRYRGFVTLEYEGEADELTVVPQAMAVLRLLIHSAKRNVKR